MISQDKQKQLDCNINFDFSIDRGGTFTDIYCEIYKGNSPQSREASLSFVYKLLSEDADYGDGPKEGIRRIIEQFTNQQIPLGTKIPSKFINQIRMGTTVATNALLERKGAKTALIITKGFRDLLHIGNQSRPSIFDLTMKRPEKIFETVVEIDERVRIVNADETSESLQDKDIVTASTGERVEILKKLNIQEAYQQLKALKQQGIEALSIVLMHSPTYKDHELALGELAKNELKFPQVSLSSQVIPMVKIVPRGFTSTLDAYLNPFSNTFITKTVVKYLNKFIEGFDDQTIKEKVFFMQSDGGLCSISNFRGSRSILSGPAGGVIGYSQTSQFILQESAQFKGVIGFDMGGTSTDVSRYDGKKFDHIFDSQIAGVMVQTPHLDINTVAAGGGSRLFYTNGVLKVGPESAGSTPGPVCYDNEGLLAITDANLILGRLIPEYFPMIFGKTKDQPLNLKLTQQKFEQITQKINEDLSTKNDLNKSIYDVAYGFVKVANETMCRPIRNLTQGKGIDPRSHVLCIFGGAGGQHACAIACKLGISQIYIHQYAGILSAFGLSKANVVEDNSIPINRLYSLSDQSNVLQFMNQLIQQNEFKLQQQGFSREQVKHEYYYGLRYDGTDTQLMIMQPDLKQNDEKDTVLEAFYKQHNQEFGFLLSNRQIRLDTLRVRSIANKNTAFIIDSDRIPEDFQKTPPTIKQIGISKTYFEIDQKLQLIDTPLYQMNALLPWSCINGPAIIINDTCTIVIEPQWRALVTQKGNISIQQIKEIQIQKNIIDSKIIECDPIELSIFGNRFMSIAEQMGRTLQRTACSTNIKERLDFSCALFDPEGNLVANAPHLPVHLGSMQEAVKYQIKFLGNSWKSSDVIMANHPQSGGSHLPDITIISPVWENEQPIFYVASRGHHADVGGLTPGSMPPFSHSIEDEGIAIKSFKLVEDGIFKEEEVRQMFTNPGPGIKGTRMLNDNISDLKAQVAANTRGCQLIQDLIKEYSLQYVHAYMRFIQQNAEESVRRMLVEISHRNQMKEIDYVQEEEYMDDGSKIKLKLTIDRIQRQAIFDFSGTSYEVLGNLNTPIAVTMSAILYCLRCLINSEIPLNQGCLRAIKCLIPDNCILNPSESAAIVGGNVLTSQRVTDLILKAFRACAASQGCMNNLTFGNDKISYYETIGGGGGAGPYWDGESGVQCHMTNTRITDPEILERRYPVILRKFQLRENSGGVGLYKGGDGIEREIEFLKNFKVSILSERRVFAPFGILGGSNGERGENIYYSKKKNNFVNIGSKNSVEVYPGDKIIIKTPGGGGYGKQEDQEQTVKANVNNQSNKLIQFGSEESFKRNQETN